MEIQFSRGENAARLSVLELLTLYFTASNIGIYINSLNLEVVNSN